MERLIIVISAVVGLGCLRTAAPSERVPDSASLPVLGSAPPFALVDQHGRLLTEHDLLGHVWIADFIFTSCSTVCPILSARMAMLQAQLTEPQLRFVSFSVDPAHDTPAVLAAYASRWRQAETRWRLLAPDPPRLADLARAMQMPLAPGAAPGEPPMHGRDFVLVDSAGVIRGVYSSENDDQLAALVADTRSLVARGSPPPATVDGAALYRELGCGGCHSDARLAPPLQGLLGSKVKLDDDRTVVADTAYLRESLLDPAKKVVEGYPPSMPSYAALLTDAQLAALVTQLSATTTAPKRDEPRQIAVDPVCGMKVSVDSATPRVEREGVTSFFCSENCRARFEAHARSN